MLVQKQRKKQKESQKQDAKNENLFVQGQNINSDLLIQLKKNGTLEKEKKFHLTKKSLDIEPDFQQFLTHKLLDVQFIQSQQQKDQNQQFSQQTNLETWQETLEENSKLEEVLLDKLFEKNKRNLKSANSQNNNWSNQEVFNLKNKDVSKQKKVVVQKQYKWLQQNSELNESKRIYSENNFMNIVRINSPSTYKRKLISQNLINKMMEQEENQNEKNNNFSTFQNFKKGVVQFQKNLEINIEKQKKHFFQQNTQQPIYINKMELNTNTNETEMIQKMDPNMSLKKFNYFNEKNNKYPVKKQYFQIARAQSTISQFCMFELENINNQISQNMQKANSIITPRNLLRTTQSNKIFENPIIQKQITNQNFKQQINNPQTNKEDFVFAKQNYFVSNKSKNENVNMHVKLSKSKNNSRPNSAAFNHYYKSGKTLSTQQQRQASTQETQQQQQLDEHFHFILGQKI